MNTNPLSNNHFFVTAYFLASGNCLQLVQDSDPINYALQATIPGGIELSLPEMERFLRDGPVQVDLADTSALPPSLSSYTRQLGCETAAYVPILQRGRLRGLVLIGAHAGQELSEEVVKAFSRTIWLAANSLENSTSPTEPIDDRRLLERKAIDALASSAANVDELRTFYNLIHDHIRSVIGSYGFVIAIYDHRTNSINIPYLYEDNAF